MRNVRIGSHLLSISNFPIKTYVLGTRIAQPVMKNVRILRAERPPKNEERIKKE